MRLVVCLLFLSVLVGLPSIGLTGDDQPKSGRPLEKPFTSVIPEPDFDKMEDLDRQIEQALQERGILAVPPVVSEPRQDNQEDQSDGGQE